MTVQPKAKLFFNLQPVKYELGKVKKKDPIIRPFTIKPRLSIKEEHLKMILNGVDYDNVIRNINFDANERANWMRACMDKDNQAYKLAKSVHAKTISMIFTDLFGFINDRKAFFEEYKIKYLQTRMRGVVNAKDFIPPVKES